MASLHKNHQKNVRFTAEQAAKIGRAALLVSEQQGELVDDAAFIRAAALQKAERVLRKAERLLEAA